MDPLRHVFSLLKFDASPPARLDAGGRWALHYAASSHVRFGGAVAGSCWLSVEGSAPFQLHAGDGWLITRGQAYQVGSEPGLPTQDGSTLFRQTRDGRVRLGGSGETILAGGRFRIDELQSEMLLEVLPPVLHLNAGTVAAPVLQAAVQILDYETTEHRFGAAVVTHHVAQIMLLQALRAVVAAPDHPPLGWLGGLADPRIGAALQLMHEQPQAPWTVAQLARAATMSRSLFALRFKSLVGRSPQLYLRELRIRFAAQALRNSQRNVAAIAFEMGYQSESAFSNAFKRVMGKAPRDYRSLT